jgi:SAM-dependent methyltransferase
MNEWHLRYLASAEWRQRIEHDLLPWTLEHVELGDHLVEVGPGPGLTTDVLRHRVDHLTAVEVDDDLARSLADRLVDANVSVVHADAADTGLADASCSAAACFTMLHHVPTAEHQDRIFAEVCRVLRGGGVFVGVDSLDSEALRAGHVDDVFNPVDPATLGDRLRAAGFAEVAVEPRELQVRFLASKA